MSTKNKKVTALLILTAILPILPITAEDDPAPELTQAKTAYDAEIKKIESSCTEKISSVQKQHVAGLGGLLKSSQEKGQLEDVLAVKKETDMAVENPDALRTAPESTVAKVNEMRNAYHTKIDEYLVEKAQSILTLTDKYETHLSELQVQLTRKGDIDQALLVKAEKESLPERPYVIDAGTVVQNAESIKAESSEEPSSEEPAEEKPIKTLPSILSRKETDETVIRKRFDELCDLIVKQDWKTSCDYVDPEFVEKTGESGVERALEGSMQFLQWTENNPKTKFKVGSIKVDREEGSAVLYPKVWLNNKWIDTDTVKWILAEDQWYMKPSAPSKTSTDKPEIPTRIPRKLW